MMVESNVLRQVMSELGKLGGAARARNLTAAKRREIALKAGKASGKARKKKAKQNAARNS